jgi:hypothetical protein
MARKDMLGHKTPRPPVTVFITGTTVSELNLSICDEQPEAGHMNYDIIIN